MYNILTRNYFLQQYIDKVIVLKSEDTLKEILDLNLEKPFVYIDFLDFVPQIELTNNFINISRKPTDYSFCLQKIIKNPLISERFFVVPIESQPVGNNIEYLYYAGCCGVKDVYSFYLHLESLLQSAQFNKLQNKHICHVIERLSRVKLIG